MKKIAIYDFCQTLVDFETADQFIYFIQKKEKSFKIKFKEQCRKFLVWTRFFFIADIIRKLIGLQGALNKKYLLWELKGLNKDKIDNYAKEYYDEIVRNRLIVKVLEEMKNQKREGYAIVVLSASYYPIIKWFKEDYNVDMVITNEFLYKNDIFQGKITNKDCIGQEKVKRLLENFPQLDMCEQTIAYGDSMSDVYVLKTVKKGVVVSKSKHKEWIEKYNLEELIW